MPAKSKSKKLVIRLRIENTSATQTIDYKGWGKEEVGGLDKAKLTNGDFISVLKALIPFNSKIKGQVRDPVVIQPKTTIDDVLAFEDSFGFQNVDYLKLELQGSVVGEFDKFKFKIPGSMIKR